MVYIPRLYKPVIHNTLNVNNESVSQMELMNDNIQTLNNNTSNIQKSNRNIKNMINYITNSSLSDEEKRELTLQMEAAIKTNFENIKNNVENIDKTLLDEQNRVIDYENNTKYINYLQDILNSEQEYVNKTYEKLSKDLETKNRQVEINTYYEKKYNKQIDVLKGVLYFSSFMIVVVFIFKMNFISESIFIGITGTWFAVLAIYMTRSIYDIYMRDEIKFDEYNFLSFFKGSENSDIDETNIHNEDDLDDECYTNEEEEDGQNLIS